MLKASLVDEKSNARAWRGLASGRWMGQCEISGGRGEGAYILYRLGISIAESAPSRDLSGCLHLGHAAADLLLADWQFARPPRVASHEPGDPGHKERTDDERIEQDA